MIAAFAEVATTKYQHILHNHSETRTPPTLLLCDKIEFSKLKIKKVIECNLKTLTSEI